MTSQEDFLGRLPCVYKYPVIFLEINLHSAIIYVIIISPIPITTTIIQRVGHF